MSRKKEIGYDIWQILRQVYNISDVTPKSEKQAKLVDKIVEYIDTNLSTRKKKTGSKESTCSKELSSSSQRASQSN